MTDTVASLLFGLAFAPELARLLARMRARMDVNWELALPKPVAPDARRSWPVAGAVRRSSRSSPSLLALGAVGRRPAARAPASRRPDPRPTSASLAAPELSFLTSAQNADGGFGGARGQRTQRAVPAWAAMGLAAAGRNPPSVRRDGHSVLDSLRARSLDSAGPRRRRAHDPRAARLRCVGLLARRRDLVAEVLRARARRLLRPSGQPHRVRGLRAARRRALRPGSPRSAPRRAGSSASRTPTAASASACTAPPATSTTPPRRCRRSWTRARHNARDVGAAAVPAARAEPRRRLTRSSRAANRTPSRPRGRSRAWSRLDATPSSVRRRGSRSPLGYLESLIAPDGSVRYSRTGAQTPVWVTAQALTALGGKTLPAGWRGSRTRSASAVL